MGFFKRFVPLALIGSAVLALAGCSGTTNQTATQPTVSSVSIAPASKELYPGDTVQLTVTATLSNGSTEAVTTGVTYSSNSPGIASVNASGLVTAGKTTGTASISASVVVDVNSTLTTTTPAQIVVNPKLLSIALSPLAASVLPGATQQLTVTGTYSSGPTQVLAANGETFVSSNTAVATVDATGLVTVAANATPGQTATITATDTASGLATPTAGSTVITVAAPLASIALTPLTASVPVGFTQQLTVIGTFTNSTTAPLAAAGETFTATSTPAGVATVDASGLVTVSATATPGQTATITAKDNASGFTTSSANSTVITVIPTPDGNVYSNGVLDNGVTFVPFGGSTNNPLPAADPATLFTDGTPALKVVVTGTANAYSGGAWVASAPRDLHYFNALRFWAMASVTLNTAKQDLKVQIGNDAGAGTNVNFQVESQEVPVTTTWKQFLIPMPDPSKAIGIDGLFSFSESADNYTLWLANVQYVNVPAAVLGGIGKGGGDGFNGVGLAGSPPSLSIAAATTYQINPGPNSIIWALGSGNLDGSPVQPLGNGGSLDNDAWRWYTLTATNTAAGCGSATAASPAVASVSVDGLISGLSAGTACITGTLAGTAIPGEVPLTVTPAVVVPTPTTSPAAPTATPEVAIYSPTYGATVAAPVWSYNVGFCGANTFASYPIAGGDTLLEYGVSGAAPCFAWADASVGGSVGGNLDVSPYTTLHVDLWMPTVPPVIDIGLVDFTGGAVRADFYIPASACTAAAWCSLDIPLSSGTAVPPFKAIGQMLMVAQSANGTNITAGNYTFYVDNFYFYTPSLPTTSPAAPTATSEVAIYSPTYGATVAAPVWSYNVGFCGANTFASYAIAGGDTLLEYGVSGAAPCFAWADASVGGSVGGNLNVSTYTTLHVDVWTPAAPPVIDIGLVDFTSGAVRADYYVTYGSGVAAACKAAAWCSLEIPLNGGVPAVPPYQALGQLLMVAQASNGVNITSGTYTLFIDNFYFH